MHQSVFVAKLPNLMSAECTTRTVHVCSVYNLFILSRVYSSKLLINSTIISSYFSCQLMEACWNILWNMTGKDVVKVSCNMLLLVSCDAMLVSCDTKVVSCDATLVSCDAMLVSCDTTLVSCDATLVSCDATLVFCD